MSEAVHQTKLRLMALNPSENPVRKRLEWVARRYSPEVLQMTMVTLAEALGRHEVVELWAQFNYDVTLDSQAVTHRTRADLLRIAKESFPNHTRYDRYLPWVAREVDRLQRTWRHAAPWTSSSALGNLVTKFRSITDWARAENVDLGRFTLDDALVNSQAWAQGRVLESMPQGRVVFRFPDGWTVQQLNTKGQLEAEGAAMQNCLDEYEIDEDDVMGPDGDVVFIFSLRDPAGRPHATMEYVPFIHEDAPYVSQLRGKQNSMPKPEYLHRMVEFRRKKLDRRRIERIDAPDHADGIAQRFLGAYLIPERDVEVLVYANGEVIFVDDFEVSVDQHRVWALEAGIDPDDEVALNEYMINTLDRMEPHELGEPLDDMAWIFWPVWLDWGGRALITNSGDEMIDWLSRAPLPR